MKRWRLLFVVLLGVVACAGVAVWETVVSTPTTAASRPAKPQIKRKDRGEIIGRSASGDAFEVELVSDEYRLSRVYLSMLGPRGNVGKIRLLEDAPDEQTVFLTGVETQVIDHETDQPISNEFFCHSNLTLNPETSSPDQHNDSLGSHADWRFFTLIPGRMSVHLPEGFGLPIRNGTMVDYFTMALNQNPGFPSRSVHFHTKLHGKRGVGGEIKPLFRRSLYVYQQHRETSAEPDSPMSPELAALLSHSPADSSRHQGELCAADCGVNQTSATPSRFAKDGFATHPGETCCVVNASEEGVLKTFGPDNTIHWMTPPGRHTYRTEVTEQLRLPFDAPIHYATGHLHPFGKSLRLVDLETGEAIIEIEAECYEDRLGVVHMDEIRSQSGVPLVAGRRYELIAEYDNPTAQPIDAMAILYIYLAERPKDGNSPQFEASSN